MTIISELGDGYKKFSSSKEFASYLRLAPNNKISGGKKLPGRTPKGKNILGKAFRDAANTVGLKKNGSLNAFFRRKAYQKGRGAAITATARKLAVIVWNMLMYKQDYSPMSEKLYDEKIKQKAIANINRKIKRLGISHEELRLHKSLINHHLQKC
jgi:hypothetical protein